MTSAQPVAAELAARIAGLKPADLPDRVTAHLHSLVIDIVGLAIAARRTDYVAAALAGLDGAGSCTLIGHRETVDSASAALVNGLAAHGEDFDDTFEGGPVHAGAVIVPAVLAAAEKERLDGSRLALALAVGVETICRLSLVAPKRVHRAGFHPTSVFGAMAAAAAVGVALRLDAQRLTHALGIAGSAASGIIEYLADGSWTKRMHPGWAAQGGLRAARLAQSGFIGPATVFEGTHGLFNGFAQTREGDWGKLLDGFGDTWVTATLAFKPFACGTMTHPYIDCALRLRARGLDADSIDSIVCKVAEGTVHRLWEPLAQKQAPPNAYAGKFSTPFCIAAGFVLGDAGLATFTEAAVRDPRIRSLAAKVRYEIDPANPYPDNYTGHVRVTLKDGRVLDEEQPHLRGGARAPLSPAEIETKFRANAAFGGWSAAGTERALAGCRTLFDTPVDLAFVRA